MIRSFDLFQSAPPRTDSEAEVHHSRCQPVYLNFDPGSRKCSFLEKSIASCSNTKGGRDSSRDGVGSVFRIPTLNVVELRYWVAESTSADAQSWRTHRCRRQRHRVMMTFLLRR